MFSETPGGQAGSILRILAQIAALCVILIPFIVTLSIFQSKFSGSQKEKSLDYTLPENLKNVTDYVADVEFTILSVSPDSRSYSVSYSLYADVDPWVSDNGFTYNASWYIQVGEELYLRRERNVIFDSVTISTGTLNKYPLDSYEANIRLQTFIPNATRFAYGIDKVPLSVSISWLSQYGWDFTLDETSRTNTSDLNSYYIREFRLKFERTVIFRLYPIFMMIAFWVITCGILYYASSILIWDAKNIDPPLAGFVIGLLFTLPVFRNTAPLGPPIGCLLDFGAFYWAILSAVLLGVGVLTKYTWLGKPGAKK